MRIDLDQSDIQAIAAEVVKAMKPILAEKKAKDDTLFTEDSLAAYLGVKKRWVRDRVQFKEIPFIKIGRFTRFKKSKIDRWLDSKEIPAINPLSSHLKRVK